MQQTSTVGMMMMQLLQFHLQHLCKKGSLCGTRPPFFITIRPHLLAKTREALNTNCEPRGLAKRGFSGQLAHLGEASLVLLSVVVSDEGDEHSGTDHEHNGHGHCHQHSDDQGHAVTAAALALAW
jgi:hypothetical protein